MTFSPPPGPCDLPRRGLSATELLAGLAGTRWNGDVTIVEETASTNAALAAAARDGAPDGSVLTADHQLAGRGRLGRSFALPERSGIAVSVLVRPRVDLARWSWLPLVAGLAVDDLVRAHGIGGSGIKWPNDVLVGERKISGILLERVETPQLAAAAIIGIGVNVSLTADERPVPTATSLLLEGARDLDRTAVVAELLRCLDRRLASWEDGPPESLREAFLARCVTLGRRVRIEQPGGVDAVGTAETVDEAGRLVVDGIAYSAGDVVHVRPAG